MSDEWSYRMNDLEDARRQLRRLREELEMAKAALLDAEMARYRAEKERDDAKRNLANQTQVSAELTHERDEAIVERRANGLSFGRLFLKLQETRRELAALRARLADVASFARETMLLAEKSP